jgi:hypothetical protein
MLFFRIPCRDPELLYAGERSGETAELNCTETQAGGQECKQKALGILSVFLFKGLLNLAMLDFSIKLFLEFSHLIRLRLVQSLGGVGGHGRHVHVILKFWLSPDSRTRALGKGPS